MPPERTPLLRKRLHVHHFLQKAVVGVPVAVHDRRQVVQPMVLAEQGGLPHQPFVALAVAEESEHPGSASPVFQRPGRPGGNREPLAERAGTHFHPWALPVRMPLEPASQLPQRPEFLHGKIPGHGQRRVQDRGGVPFAQEEPVPVFRPRVRRVVPHHFEEQGRHDVRGRQRRTRMTRARRLQHDHDLTAHSPRGFLQLHVAISPNNTGQAASA